MAAAAAAGDGGRTERRQADEDKTQSREEGGVKFIFFGSVLSPLLELRFPRAHKRRLPRRKCSDFFPSPPRKRFSTFGRHTSEALALGWLLAFRIN